MASWPIGYAAVCKTVYPGSNPGDASKELLEIVALFFVLIFRKNQLKIYRLQEMPLKPSKKLGGFLWNIFGLN